MKFLNNTWGKKFSSCFWVFSPRLPSHAAKLRLLKKMAVVLSEDLDPSHCNETLPTKSRVWEICNVVHFGTICFWQFLTTASGAWFHIPGTWSRRHPYPVTLPSPPRVPNQSPQQETLAHRQRVLHCACGVARGWWMGAPSLGENLMIGVWLGTDWLVTDDTGARFTNWALYSL